MRHPAPPQQPSFAAAARSPFPPPAPSGEVPTPTAPAWQPQTENPIVIPVSGNKGPTVDLNPPPFKPRRGRIPNAVKAAMALQAEAAAQGVAA